MNKYIRYKENNKNKICLHCGAENDKDAIKCKVCNYDEFGYSHGNSFKIDKETRQIICGCGCKDKLILKYREKTKNSHINIYLCNNCDNEISLEYIFKEQKN